MSGGASGDPCGNAVGNGAQIIPGPAAPGGSDTDRPFTSLVVSATDPDLVYVGTERNGIVRSRDGGHTWERLRAGLRHSGGSYPEVYDLAVAPGDGSVLLAATSDSPGPLTGDVPSAIAGVYRSVDGGASWTRANCGLPSGSVTSVQVLDAAGRRAVVGVSAGTATFAPLAGTSFPGGVFLTTDGGGAWSPVQSTTSLAGFRFTQIRRAAATGEVLTYARHPGAPGQSGGFFRSTDQGASWSPLANPFAGRSVTHFDVSSDGRILWVNTEDTFRIWRSGDGGVSWGEVGGFIANGAVAVSRGNSNVVLLDDFGTLRRTTDAFATHRTVLTSQQPIEDIAFAPSTDSVVYAVSRGYDVYRSVDGGISFRLMVNLRATVLRQE